jgi:hypothetical protein
MDKVQKPSKSIQYYHQNLLDSSVSNVSEIHTVSSSGAECIGWMNCVYMGFVFKGIWRRGSLFPIQASRDNGWGKL